MRLFKVRSVYLVIVAVGSSIVNAHVRAAGPPPIVIEAWGEHSGANLVYRYRVRSATTRTIRSWALGDNLTLYKQSGSDENWDNQTIFPHHYAQIKTIPLGAVLGETWGGGTYAFPANWGTRIENYQDTDQVSIHWSTDKAGALAAGQEAEFSVTVPAAGEAKYGFAAPVGGEIDFMYPAGPDDAYLTGDFTARFFDGASDDYYVGKLTRIDSKVPTLGVTATPSSVSNVCGASLKVPVQTQITVSDDYDRQPEIKLESITSNQGMNAGDVQQAAFGTDDRLFILSTKCTGTGPRIYTITYSATDGSGNKATASAAVTMNP